MTAVTRVPQVALLLAVGAAVLVCLRLRLALATLPADRNRRIVLLSDGAETILTNGSALDVAAEARAGRQDLVEEQADHETR